MKPRQEETKSRGGDDWSEAWWWSGNLERPKHEDATHWKEQDVQETKCAGGNRGHEMGARRNMVKEETKYIETNSQDFTAEDPQNRAKPENHQVECGEMRNRAAQYFQLPNWILQF